MLHWRSRQMTMGSHETGASNLCWTFTHFLTSHSAVPWRSAPMLPPNKPEKLYGNSAHCCSLLLQCRLHFENLGGLSDHQKLTHFLGLLTRDIMQWANALRENDNTPVAKYDPFIATFWCVFNHVPEGKEVSTHLLSIRHPVESCWNEPTLKAVFCQGLKDEIEIEIACCEGTQYPNWSGYNKG